MPEIPFTAIFGVNSVQTLETITLTKADFVDVGLTPTATNSAEAILTAIIKKAQPSLTQELQDSNPDQSIVIANGFPSLPQRNGITYRRNEKTVSFDKVDTASELDPDDY